MGLYTGSSVDSSESLFVLVSRGLVHFLAGAQHIAAVQWHSTADLCNHATSPVLSRLQFRLAGSKLMGAFIQNTRLSPKPTIYQTPPPPHSLLFPTVGRLRVNAALAKNKKQNKTEELKQKQKSRMTPNSHPNSVPLTRELGTCRQRVPHLRHEVNISFVFVAVTWLRFQTTRLAHLLCSVFLTSANIQWPSAKHLFSCLFFFSVELIQHWTKRWC